VSDAIEQANALLRERGYAERDLAVHTGPRGKALLKGNKILSPLSDEAEVVLRVVRELVPTDGELGAKILRPAELRAKLTEAGVDISSDRSWSQLADHAYSHFVEPELTQPTIVYDWPIELSPFARTTDDDETLVERFEAVVSGMEIAMAKPM